MFQKVWESLFFIFLKSWKFFLFENSAVAIVFLLCLIFPQRKPTLAPLPLILLTQNRVFSIINHGLNSGIFERKKLPGFQKKKKILSNFLIQPSQFSRKIPKELVFFSLPPFLPDTNLSRVILDEQNPSQVSYLFVGSRNLFSRLTSVFFSGFFWCFYLIFVVYYLEKWKFLFIIMKNEKFYLIFL